MRHYRKERIGSLIRNVIGAEICLGMHDPRIAKFTSVTRVEVAGDLAIAKVYLSVAGDAADERKTLAAVRHAAGHLQRKLAGSLNTRQCPKLQFLIDKSVKGVRETMRLIEENRRARGDAEQTGDKAQDDEARELTDAAPSGDVTEGSDA